MELQEIKDYLRRDDDFDDELIKNLIDIGEVYIDSLVGTSYKTDTKLVKLSELLQKKIIADMYDTRTTEIPSNTKQDRITVNILDRLSNI